MPGRLMVIIACSILLLNGLTGCGGAGGTLDAETPAAITPAGISLSEAMAEIRATEPPADVSASVFEMLQRELIDALVARGDDRLTAAAPHGDDNVVSDLYLYGDATSGMRLEWTYCNTGDYNKDGLVGLGDLTTVGQNYEESIYGEHWAAARHADGNHDGLVTVGDITPIGQKYNTFLAGYNIYGALEKDGTRETVGSLPNEDFGADSFFDITYEIPDEDEDKQYFWVVPFDGEGNEGVCSVVSRPTGDAALVTVGTDTAVISDTIGEDGGDFVGPDGTPLEDMVFRFKPGTVPPGTPLTLGINDGSVAPVAGEFGGSIIYLDTGAVKEFGEPVEILIPYPREDWDYMYVPYAVAEDGSLAALNLLEHTRELEFARFTTMFALKFTWIKVKLTSFPPGLWQTTYRPGTDGFQVYNFGSNFSPGGQCAGMSFFSRWYWINKAKVNGGMFDRWMYDVGENYLGQHIIGIRAHTSINRVYGQTKAMYLWYEDTATDEQNFLAVCNSLVNSGRPVVIGLTQTTGTGGHAVLAYGFQDDGLLIYDPNTSGDPRFITYNASTKLFTPYGPFDNIYLAGDDIGVATYESFDNIYYDANYGFTNYGWAAILVTTHADGEVIAAGTTDIHGYVQSGQLLADTLNMYVEGVCYTRSLPENGYFEYNGIPIGYGINDIWFQVYGTSQNGQSWIPVEQGYELDLTGSATPPVLGVTLVWDQPNTDLDLYVTDPTGETSWFNNHQTSDGGYFYSNVTDGYGPEYWNLGQDDTVRYGQAYTIRVHYRDGDSLVAALLGIRYYEGTGFDEYSLQPAWFFTSDHDNTAPGSTGNDWKTLAHVVLVNHYSSTVGDGGIRVEQGADGVPTVYVPAR